MALSSSTVWEVRTTGSDTNGGGYSSGGVDYSQQDSAQLSVTDAACTGNTTVTSATGGFTSAMIGNVMYLSSGPGWYQITARTDTNTVTIDRNGPNATGMTANVGGAFATPAACFGSSGPVVSDNIVYVKTGTYDRSASLAIKALSTLPLYIIGYGTIRGDNGQFTLRATAGSITLLAFTDSVVGGIKNCILDANGNTSVTGLFLSYNYAATCTAENCKAVSCATGFSFGSSRMCSSVFRCWAASCTVGFNHSDTGVAYDCYASSCATGFILGGAGGSGAAVGCIAKGGTIGFSLGGVSNSNGGHAYRCVAYATSSDGFYSTGYVGAMPIQNCVAYGCGGYGFSQNQTTAGLIRFLMGGGNAYGSNTSGNLLNIPASPGDVTLTADPFVDAANGDFNLNDAIGGGRSLRAVTFEMVGGTGTSVYPFMDWVVPSAPGPAAILRQFTNIGTY